MKSSGLYRMSAVRTVIFYGTVLAVCFLFPIIVCLGISLFFLKFYRKQVREFFAARGGWTGAGDGKTAPPPFGAIRFDHVPRGTFGGEEE